MSGMVVGSIIAIVISVHATTKSAARNHGLVETELRCAAPCRSACPYGELLSSHSVHHASRANMAIAPAAVASGHETELALDRIPAL